MTSVRSFVEGAALGAISMYYLDPDEGRSRRTRAVGKVVHLLHDVRRAIIVSGEDFENRGVGYLAELRNQFTRGTPNGPVLVERVRSRVGRLVGHPGAIWVTANDGTVTLSGPVFRSEVDRLVNGVCGVRGVQNVINQLSPHIRADGISALQGSRRSAGGSQGALDGQWPPSGRFLACAAGAILLLNGLRRPGLIGGILDAIGIGLLVRGVGNASIADLLGFTSAQRLIRVQKTVTVPAPVEEVYFLWSHPENFPLFMNHVREVRPIGGNRYAWTIVGPAGVPIDFETVMTAIEPNRFLAWRSVEGSRVGQIGSVRFESEPNGRTRLDIKLSYRPPAGWIGNAIAELFGSDPKQALDADMVRFKSLLVSHKTTAHEQTVTLDQVVAADREQTSPSEAEPERPPAGPSGPSAEQPPRAA